MERRVEALERRVEDLETATRWLVDVLVEGDSTLHDQHEAFVARVQARRVKEPR